METKKILCDWSTDSAREKLIKLISGRENSNEWVDPNAKQGRVTCLTIWVNIIDGHDKKQIRFPFKVHADTKCKSMKHFLDHVTNDNISFAKGPRNGSVLGLNGKFIEGFFVYSK